LPATIGSGLLILVGGLSVLLGIWADLGALLLVVFLVSTAVLMLLALIALVGTDLGLTITGPLFDVD
jgi:putative oxidoreductase